MTSLSIDSSTPEAQLQRLVKARIWLIQNHPFFGHLAMYLEIILDESVETMAVDGEHLFVAPSFLPKITEAELRGILVHEILHCAFLHHVRRGERDPELWNEAADYVINPTVIESGFKLPAGALLEGRFKGMGAEEVYSLLKAKAKQQPQRGKAGQGQPGQAPGQPQAGPTAPGQAPGQGVGHPNPPKSQNRRLSGSDEFGRL